MKKILLFCLLLGSIVTNAQSYQTYKKADSASKMLWKCTLKKKGGHKSHRFRITIEAVIPQGYHLYAQYQPAGAEAWPVRINPTFSLQDVTLRTPNKGSFYMDTTYYTPLREVGFFQHPRERTGRSRWIKTSDSLSVSQNGVRIWKKVKYRIDYNVRRKTKITTFDPYEKNRKIDIIVNCPVRYILCTDYQQYEIKTVDFSWYTGDIYAKFKHKKIKQQME